MQRSSLQGLEWSGCILGLLGAFLLATNTEVSRYGWIAFLAANLAMKKAYAFIGVFALMLGGLCLYLYDQDCEDMLYRSFNTWCFAPR